MGPRDHVLDGDPDPKEKGQFWGLTPIEKHWESLLLCTHKGLNSCGHIWGQGRTNPFASTRGDKTFR